MEKPVTISYLGGCAGALPVSVPEHGLRHLAVPAGGPVDPTAMAIANKLVGNSQDTPILELPLSGGRWQLAGEGTLAVTGADMGWSLNGRSLPTYTVTRFSGNAELRGGYAAKGMYAYLAIQGKGVEQYISLPRNTNGNNTGKSWMSKANIEITNLPLSLPVEPTIYENNYTCVPLPGPEWRWLKAKHAAELVDVSYRVSPASSRQGLRLTPEPPWRLNALPLPNILSSPVLPGTVQLTPSGLIVLGPDAQTIGGYPRVMVLDAEQVARCYQLGIGGEVTFRLP